MAVYEPLARDPRWRAIRGLLTEMAAEPREVWRLRLFTVLARPMFAIWRDLLSDDVPDATRWQATRQIIREALPYAPLLVEAASLLAADSETPQWAVYRAATASADVAELLQHLGREIAAMPAPCVATVDVAELLQHITRRSNTPAPAIPER